MEGSECPTPSIFLSPIPPSTRRMEKVGGGGAAAAGAAVEPKTPKSSRAPSSAAIFSPWRTPAKVSAAQRHVAAPANGDDDAVWNEGTVAFVVPACEAGTSVVVRVQVSPNVHEQYHSPGQYVKIRPQDGGEGVTKPLFLAMSSPPPVDGGEGANEKDDSPFFEFLVKETHANGWLALAAYAGTAVQVSHVLGSGFPVAENLEGFEYDFPTHNVLLFAAGSGIGPIKAAIESGQLLVGSGGWTARLYYGERTESGLCFADQFEAWEAMGYEVKPVLSQPTDPSAWTGEVGYVQDVLDKDGVEEPHRSGALVVGMKGMSDAVKESLRSAGIFDKRVLFNY